MIQQLSPIAQAVQFAAFRVYNEEELLYVVSAEKHAGMVAAAALRATAEEVVLSKYQYADWEMAHLIMQEIQAITDEIEAQ